MRIPNADSAVIAIEKLRDYLLNPDHRKGGAKARLLLALGFSRDEPNLLEWALREQHLTQDFESRESNAFGEVFVIAAWLASPRGRKAMLRSIWQIDTGTDVPRLITMYPD